MLSTAGLTCCNADTSFLFSPSRVNFSVNGFKNGTGAFDLVMPSGLTGFFGMLAGPVTCCVRVKQAPQRAMYLPSTPHLCIRVEHCATRQLQAHLQTYPTFANASRTDVSVCTQHDTHSLQMWCNLTPSIAVTIEQSPFNPFCIV